MSLPPPAAAPATALPRRPGSKFVSTGSSGDRRAGFGGVDVSLRLPAEAHSPPPEEVAAAQSTAPEAASMSAIGTALDVLTPTAAAGEGLADDTRASQHAQRHSDSGQSSPSEPSASSREPEQKARAATVATHVWPEEHASHVLLPDRRSHLEPPSTAQQDAHPPSTQLPALRVPAPSPSVSKLLSGRLQPFKQPKVAAHGMAAAAEPPSPTFSAMERAASAAAMVAARLFDMSVRPGALPCISSSSEFRHFPGGQEVCVSSLRCNLHACSAPEPFARATHNEG